MKQAGEPDLAAAVKPSSGLRDRLARIAAYSAPALIALHGVAFAAGQQAQSPQIIHCGGVLAPSGTLADP